MRGPESTPPEAAFGFIMGKFKAYLGTAIVALVAVAIAIRVPAVGRIVGLSA